jgi:protein translocase SecG subunit
MNVVLNLVLVLQMLSALAMIGLILVQHGKGADMGTAFGSGASGSLFGASGSANFLSRSTAVLATVFLRLHAGLGLLRLQRAQRAGGRRAACWIAKRRFGRRAGTRSGCRCDPVGRCCGARAIGFGRRCRRHRQPGRGADSDQVSGLSARTKNDSSPL